MCSSRSNRPFYPGSNRGGTGGLECSILTSLPSVAVVIRAKNERRFIGEVLTAILAPNALQPRQVVVVDSGSTDGTQEIVRRFPTTLIQIKPEEFTYGFALNLGVAHVDTEIVATLSAHSTPSNDDWLRNLTQPFQQARVAGVYGKQLPRENATILELAGMRLTGVLSDKPRLLEHRPLFSNAN